MPTHKDTLKVCITFPDGSTDRLYYTPAGNTHTSDSLMALYLAKLSPGIEQHVPMSDLSFPKD